MSAPAGGAVEGVLRRLTTFGLDGRDDEIMVPADVVDQVVAAAVDERLIGVLAVAAAAGAAALPAGAGEAVEERWRDAMATCLRLEVRLLDLAGRFEQQGIPFLVLKGPAAAHLDEPDPSLRPFVDLDLLVPGTSIDAAVHLLADGGATRPWAPRRPGWDGRYAKSVTMRMVDGVEVDLHRMLVDGALGHRMALDDLWSRRSSFQLGGRRIDCLDRTARALHAVYHAVLGSPEPRRMSLREVAAHLTDPALEPDDLIALVDRWGGRAVFVTGLEVLEARTGLRPEGYEQCRREPLPAAERALVARQRTEGSALGRAKLDALAAMAWRDRPGYLLALVVPSGEHLRSRGLRRRDLFGGPR
ncbi:MAG: nucleotidyltransferase family protein [Acidimicrobiales bacterium]